MMETKRLRTFTAIAAAGAFAFGVALYAAPPDKQSTAVDNSVTLPSNGAIRVIAGPEHVRHSDLPIYEPMKVDYLKQSAPSLVEAVLVPGTIWESSGALDKALSTCQIDAQCAVCDVCVDYRCEAGKCVIDTVTDGETDDGCDDGLYCNGEELCSGGACTLGNNVPDCTTGGQVCDEVLDACVDPCDVAADCDDGLECTDDSCGVDGVCVHVGNCGPNAQCLEPFEGNPKTCIAGRCCRDEVCSRRTYEDCTGGPGGDWLAAGATDTDCNDLISQCPNYEGGIIADSALTAVIGPLSNLDCDNLVRLGDDYTSSLHGTGPDAPNDNYMNLELLRFVGGAYPDILMAGRWSIELRDAAGTLIENVWFPDGTNDAGDLGIRAVNFDPPIAVPTTGIISFSVQANFGLDGRMFLGATSGTTTGTNNAATMYVQTTADSAASIRDYLGVCAGGARNGEFCDRGNGNEDCPSGNCDDVADVLSFELVGARTTAPLGACCDSDTGACTSQLKWDCDAAGNIFQGEGTLCGICEDGTTPCTPGGDPVCAVECTPILACENSACCEPGGDCRLVQDAASCVDPENFLGFGTDCDPDCCPQPTYTGADRCDLMTPTLVTVPALGQPPVSVTLTGNNAGATYDDWEFVCIGGPNAGTACAGDLECGVCSAGDIGAQCMVNADCDTAPGNGVCDGAGVCSGGNDGAACTVDTDCDTYTGAADGRCGARCAQWCNSTIFDPDDTTKDPGWWMAFELSACALVRIDLCCTDTDGLGSQLQPQWSNLYTTCPCGDAPLVGQEGVDTVGLGRGTDGFARGGPYCNDDNLWETFTLRAGTYYKPIYSAPAGTSAVPPGAEYQFHITAVACPIASCCLGDTCIEADELECEDQGGYWLIGNTDCGLTPACTDPLTDNPCCTGSCCLGPGQCIDDIDGQPIGSADCAGQDGEFVGGATCVGDPDNFLPEPCPTCPLENCLENDGTFVNTADGEYGVRRAEDFIATSSTVSQVCVVGTYIDDTISCDGAWCDCSCQGVTSDQDLLNLVGECNPVVVDDFEVCIHADAGLGSPGEASIPVDPPVGCSLATVVRTPATVFTNFAEWDTSLVLDDTIGPLIPGQIYWAAVVNTTTLPPGNICNWNWAASDSGGNAWSVYDLNGVWEPRDGRGQDFVICTEHNTGGAPAATGVCCVCEPLGACVDDRSRAECETIGGAWVLGASCDTYTCPQARPLGDDCATDVIVLPSVDDQIVPFTNQCSITDGPADVNLCLISLPNDIRAVEFGGDLWYYYTASCDGRMTVSMCEDADYDAIAAVYTDGTSTCYCPTGTDQPQVPSDCGDDTCGPGGGPPEISKIVQAGNCYTLRIAGWEGAQGSGSFSVSCVGVDCPLSLAPTGDFSPTPADTGFGTKNRYMTFRGGEAGRSQAVRVKFDSMPGYEYAELREMWVQEPIRTTEASGSDGTAEPAFWTAQLGCAPYYRDWSIYDRVDVYGASIIPDAVYDVQLIDADCQTSEEGQYSEALVVSMSEAGDLIRDCGTQPCPSPNGVIDFTDISACVDKFRNLPTAPRKARADVINSNVTFGPPDRKVDFVDISCVVDAFRGQPCALPGPPAVDPCAR